MQIDQWGVSPINLTGKTKAAKKIVTQATVLWPKTLFGFEHRLKKELENCKDDDWENICETLRTEIEILQMV